MANFHDRVQVLRFAAGISDEDEMIRLMSDRGLGTEKSLSGLIARNKSLSNPNSATIEKFVLFFVDLLNNNDVNVSYILNMENHFSIYDLFKLLKIRTINKNILLSLTKSGIVEWNNRYGNIEFMNALSNSAISDIRSRAIMNCMVGTYYMYRRHSTLPGILKELIVVENRNLSDCNGTYFQYSNISSANEIKFNAFPCGFYIQAFALHNHSDPSADKYIENVINPDEIDAYESEIVKKFFEANSRIEVIDTRILINNVVRHVNGEVAIDKDRKYFVGMLSGVYDYGDILLSERVMIKKIEDEPNKNKHPKTKRLMADSVIDEDVIEYNEVRDVISNARDGQTLATRISRLEMM
ncbi:hypothetical protein [Hoeflea sp. EC-HK425]|uniref:hypothetical protein n=1 Tax=Hoeflea sp. EC-HK425 TaxID=2038388 RepID=UPI00125B0BDD|nr:hypothetical protein [Hoeflea sp. EC-HK425]VVT05440.1 hypothetical protein HOE425_320309 [Hoeflea sp. EC-HK425]|tara:strand:- start:937 stop:1998 length:1062 start_codon:yes stop_codon:yes gene_type:complete